MASSGIGDATRKGFDPAWSHCVSIDEKTRYVKCKY